MTRSFAQRSGDLAISYFDTDGPQGPLNVSDEMSSPGELAYASNSLVEALAVLLVTKKSAAWPQAHPYGGPDSPAQGVVGSWDVGSPSYSALWLGYSSLGLWANSARLKAPLQSA
jgi:hypothetical protein